MARIRKMQQKRGGGGGQYDSQFVANFLMNSTMEKFRKSVNICQSYGQKYRGPFFNSQRSIIYVL